MNITLSVERVKQWSLKGGLAITDQVVFSGANFAFNVLLARWLSSSDYGAFAISFTILLIFYQLHSSLLLDPMSILGPVNHSERLYTYFWEQVRLHFFITVSFGTFVILCTLFYEQFPAANIHVSKVLITLGLVLPFQLLPWLLRRVFYVVLKPAISALGSTVYAFVILIGLFILRWSSLLSTITAVALMGIAGLSGSMTMLLWLKEERRNEKKKNIVTLFKQNWSIAGWLVASAVLVVMAGQAQIFIAANILGIEAAGIVRALQNFAQPMILIVTAFGNLAIPTLSADFGRADFKSFRHKVSIISVASISMASIYWLLLFLLRKPLELFLYGGKYSSYSDLIPIWGIIPLLLAINVAPASALQAFQKAYALLLVSVFWTIASVGSAVLFSNRWGIWGATASAVFGYFVAVTVFLVLYIIWVKKEVTAVRL